MDALAKNEAEREAYRMRYDAYRETEKALRELEALAKKSKADADYVQYRYRMLEEAREFVFCRSAGNKFRKIRY